VVVVTVVVAAPPTFAASRVVVPTGLSTAPVVFVVGLGGLVSLLQRLPRFFWRVSLICRCRWLAAASFYPYIRLPQGRRMYCVVCLFIYAFFF
jgi:hypothetical protein